MGVTGASSRRPVPGSSFVKEEPIRGREPKAAAAAALHAGMTSPSVTDDGWWLAHLWVADDDGIVDALNLAPAAGPPPGTPIAALGPRLAGALSGLIAEEDGRQLIRLRMPAVADEARPWQRPMLVMLAMRWDPVRASVMTRNALAHELIVAFASAVEALSRPS
jgi:hypothetical protein